MKKLFKTTLFIALTVCFSFGTMAQGASITKTAHIKFFSEKGGIAANNYAVISKLNLATGDLLFSAPVQSFEFANATMQKHFNQEGVMDSKNHPKAKFVGKVTNLGGVDLTKNGEYTVKVAGELTIKGVTKKVETSGKITVKGGKIMATSTFTIDRFEYGVSGKSKSVSQNIQLTINATYEKV